MITDTRNGNDTGIVSVQRKASVFCYWASESCSLLARQGSEIFLGKNYRRTIINPGHQKCFSC